MNIKLLSLCLILLSILLNFSCIKIIPERAYITFYNDTYIGEPFMSVRRSTRRGEYVMNACVNVKYSVGNNVSVDYIFYEYLHNEYRRSFIELHFRLCDLILKDPYIGELLRRSGLATCPLRAEKYCIKNATLDMDIPSVFPFKKGQVKVIMKQTDSGFVLIRAEIMVTFKQTLYLPKIINKY